MSLLLTGIGRGNKDSAAWSPASLPNLAGWWDASDTTTTFQDSAATTPATANNDPVGCIKDKSGNARHFIQASATLRPLLKTAVINGLNIIQGDVVDDVLGNTYTEVTGSTWWFIMNIKSTGSGGSGLYMTSSARIFLEENSPRGYSVFAGTSLDSNVLPPGAYTTITMSIRWNGASTIIRTQATNRVTGNAGSSSGSNLKVCGTGGANKADGKYCEWGVCESILSLSDIQLLETYGGTKWLAS